MTKTRKNYAMRISAILLILTMTSLCMVSGTFAKYTATASGTDTARVAKFLFNLNDSEMVWAQSITVDLFKSAYKNGETVKVKSTEDPLDKVVAPGTSGVFAIKTENKGEVAVKTNFTFEEINDNKIPIQYAVTTSENLDGNETWKPAAGGVSIPGAGLGVGAPATTQYVHWKWVTPADVEGGPTGNEADTTLGKAGTAKVNTTITCTVEQDLGTNPGA